MTQLSRSLVQPRNILDELLRLSRSALFRWLGPASICICHRSGDESDEDDVLDGNDDDDECGDDNDNEDHLKPLDLNLSQVATETEHHLTWEETTKQEQRQRGACFSSVIQVVHIDCCWLLNFIFAHLSLLWSIGCSSSIFSRSFVVCCPAMVTFSFSKYFPPFPPLFSSPSHKTYFPHQNIQMPELPSLTWDEHSFRLVYL